MIPFVKKYDPEIRTRKVRDTYNDNHELYRDSKSFVPSIWSYIILAIIPLITLGVWVHPGWFIAASIFTMLGSPIICMIMVDEFDANPDPYLFVRKTWTMKYHYNPDSNYYPKSIPRENISSPIYQEALNELINEAQTLGDKFDIHNWGTQLEELDQALTEQFELEKEALNKFNRTDYAALVKQTNAIMREGMKNV